MQLKVRAQQISSTTEKSTIECVRLRAGTRTINPPQPAAPKQTPLHISLAHAVAYERTNKKRSDITKAVAYHVAKDMAPVETVEQSSFMPLLKTVSPRYQFPGPHYFAGEVLPKMYTEVRGSLAAHLTPTCGPAQTVTHI